MLKKLKNFFVHKYTLQAIYWGYNIVYLGFIGVFILGMTEEFVRQDAIPWNVTVAIYTLILLPVLAVWFGLTKSARNEAKKLIGFLFAVELPIFFMSFIRIVAIRQMTWILWFMFISIIVALVSLIIFYTRKKSKKLRNAIALFLSQETALILGSYFILLFLFFVPIIIAILIDIIKYIDISDIFEIIIRTKGLALFTTIFFSLFFLLTFGFFLITPIIAFFTYRNSFRASRDILEKDLKFKHRKTLQYSFLGVYLLLAIVLSFQWQGISYTYTIENYLKAYDYESQQQYAEKIIKNDSSIQNILLNKYLSPYRFLGDSSGDTLKRSYTHDVGLPDNLSENIQGMFYGLASPFIYQGKFYGDVSKSKDIYEQLFDKSIQEGERNEIVSALKATNTKDSLRSGILDEEKQTVHLVSKKITAESSSNNTFARVTIEEEYENKSDETQEVYYEFTLPEGATVTGLWLGSDLEEIGVIAPKGAASRVYNEQVRRQVDPALLEQIGPRQYRLKVYPILVEIEEVGNQRVKFEYMTFTSPEGIELPKITKTRNVYENNKTDYQYFLNEEEVTANKILYTDVNHCNDKAFTIETMAGNISFIPHHLNPSLKNYDCKTLSFTEIPEIKDKKIAILLDTSYSNILNDWTYYLNEYLEINSMLKDNKIEGYFFNNMVSEPFEITSELLESGIKSQNIGQTDRLNALNKIDDSYDFIIMLTDSSDSDLEPNDIFTLNHNVPIYMFHMDNAPQYQDDLTQAVIKTGGKVVDDLFDVRTFIALEEASNSEESELIEVDKYGTWIIGDGYSNLPGDFDDILANQKAVSYLIQNMKKYINGLDEIHKIAQEFGIVTPYSSYIALVTDRQKADLKRESEMFDRFEKDFETGEVNLKRPQGSNILNIGGTPEPEEWALMITAAFLLLYLYRDKLKQFLVNRKW